jgi:hypothetical protein
MPGLYKRQFRGRALLYRSRAQGETGHGEKIIRIISALRRAAERQATGDESRLNLEDIPRLTDEQLAFSIG